MNKIITSRHALIAAFFFLVVLSTTQSAHAQLSFFSLTPCRVIDTRNPNSVDGGPILTAGTRNFTVRGVCGVPTSAKAVSVNVAITGVGSNGYLTLWPSGQTQPNTATINFTTADQALSNGAIIGLSTNAQDLSVFCASSFVHLIVDVTGYFQ